MRLSWQSARQAVRSLRRSPGFSITVILSLTLGFGANASVFTVLNAVVLRPLPYPRSDELLFVGLGKLYGSVPLLYYKSWMESNRTLTAAAQYYQVSATVGGTTEPEEIPGAVATAGLAKLFDASPELGRFLSGSDEQADAEPAVVLSHGLWKRHFGGDSNIVGRTIRISDRPMTVVGVMPQAFDFPSHAEFWRPMSAPSGSSPADNLYAMVARSRPDVTVEKVQRDLARILRPAIAGLPRPITEAPVAVVSLHAYLYGSQGPALSMLLAAVLLLHVITCANVASLVLARTESRRPEFAVRVALGASREVLIGHVLSECVWLSATAGALGLLFSIWITRLFVGFGPQIVRDVGNFTLDGHVLLATLALTLITGVSAGIGAALRTTQVSSFASLGEANARTTGAGRSFILMRRVLVVGQMAMAMLLLGGGGLLVKSFLRASSVDLGFEPEHVLVASLALPRSRYPDAASAQRFYDEVSLRLRGVPGVERVAYGTPPLSGFAMMRTSASAERQQYSIATDEVGPGYFETYRIPIFSGRAIAASDDSMSPPVVVINRAAASMIFPGRDAIGQRISALTVAGEHPTVVGVVADVPQYYITMAPQPEAFSPLTQARTRPYTLAVRARGNAEALLGPLRRIVRDYDPELAVRASTLESMVGESTAPQRFASILVGIFATLALVVAAVGLFGLVSYLAIQRTREIGVRVALGAQRRDVVQLIVREGMVLAAAGIAIGFALSLPLNGLLVNQLFEVQPHDSGIVFGSGLLLAGVALAATLIPALGAARMDPIVALRKD